MQRVRDASVTVGDELTGQIGAGLVILLGVEKGDAESDLEYILNKTIGLRIFPDEQGRMSLDLTASGGALLVVSQFTLFGDVRKGRRPSFEAAAPPDIAESFYESFIEKARERGLDVECGRFGAMMDVRLTNDGPVTIILDSKKIF